MYDGIRKLDFLSVDASVGIDDVEKSAIGVKAKSKTQTKQLVVELGSFVLKVAKIGNRMDIKRWSQNIAIFSHKSCKEIGLKAVFRKTSNRVYPSKAV